MSSLAIRDFASPICDLSGTSILVTGGTGSFGRAFVETVVDRFQPERLIIFSRDELKQYEMAQRWSTKDYPFIRYFLGDVRDAERLEMAMRGVDYVIHAAALKHVPAAEYNPFKCIRTNVHGAENIVQTAIRTGARRILALSTDKAANPINLYGASKLAADKIFIAANSLVGGADTRFAAVRYGNVLNSRGSVVPYFRRLVEEGTRTLPITDPRMTRFWITLPNAINFVLSSLASMRGGEIFVPKIPSMRITDLADAIGPGLEHEVVGIRPGEKLHEAMITSDDARDTIDLGDRFVIEPSTVMWERRSFLEDGGRRVPDDFEYTSDSNEEWLDLEDLRALL